MSELDPKSWLVFLQCGRLRHVDAISLIERLRRGVYFFWFLVFKAKSVAVFKDIAMVWVMDDRVEPICECPNECFWFCLLYTSDAADE